MRFIVRAVTGTACRGGEDDRREPRRGRCGCRRGPRSTFRSVPRVPLRAVGGYELLPQPAGRARREHRVPGARSSSSAREGRPRGRRPRAIPGRGKTPARDLRGDRTPGRPPGPVRRARNDGCGPRRRGAAESGCSKRPRPYPGRPRSRRHQRRCPKARGSAAGSGSSPANGPRSAASRPAQLVQHDGPGTGGDAVRGRDGHFQPQADCRAAARSSDNTGRVAGPQDPFWGRIRNAVIA